MCLCYTIESRIKCTFSVLTGTWIKFQEELHSNRKNSLENEKKKKNMHSFVFIYFIDVREIDVDSNISYERNNAINNRLEDYLHLWLVMYSLFAHEFFG